MRLLKNYMAFFALIALLFSSCSKDETVNVDGDVADNAASIYFGPVLADLGNQFSRQQEQDIPECSTDDPAYAQIKLTYGEDDTPVEVVVEILQDDQGLFTAYDDALEIPIPSGETTVSVTLTDFVVWNDVDGAPGMPIWVAPKEGSEYAQFVSDPLSNTFNLRAGSKNYVNVDVICFDDRDVNLYGYQFFDINPVPLYEFCVFANYCTDAGRHYTADYTFAIYEYDAEAEDGKGEMIYEGLSPETGNDDGTYWADPLCVVIPGPGDVASDQPYLVFEATLSDWDGYYTAEEDDESVITETLSWDMIQMLFDEDGSDETTEYWHIFFNCASDDGPVCDINDPEADCDNDGIPNGEDNCPQTSNEDQADFDEDGLGDVCDPDIDNDGVPNDEDDCDMQVPDVDEDGDGCEDIDPGCDPEDAAADCDNDGIPNGEDNCPAISNSDQADFDEDGMGDACDPDIDNDGVPNAEDDCDFEVPVVDEDGDGCEDEAGSDCEWTITDPGTNCFRATLNGEGDSFVEITLDTGVPLFEEGEIVAAGTFGITLTGSGLEYNFDTGTATVPQYNIQVTDSSGGAIACSDQDDDNNIVEGSFTYPIYVRVAANICEPN
ncbi:hypothetical protein G3I01_10895 [Gramella sp. MT6]|uniref:thrombospondin type 3 repeat-containing protein n=1 Tax=Gramella sp. MT6 TaxID=2705471 RepID=UPI001C5D151A|nr:thrombospondin type 3 repeat-containing protein [Gramella sp. MT6]QYA25999.1 hypothetical protein G3I01_10895 [Gramella sp. MT6]